jgi:hypothetical protein
MKKKCPYRKGDAVFLGEYNLERGHFWFLTKVVKVGEDGLIWLRTAGGQVEGFSWWSAKIKEAGPLDRLAEL